MAAIIGNFENTWNALVLYLTNFTPSFIKFDQVVQTLFVQTHTIHLHDASSENFPRKMRKVG